ncbi:hypothetical protein HDE_07485 [Halotydeus destructor]|nr:hypothetical protein HDE_07485 [Halotydeus destructor]
MIKITLIALVIIISKVCATINLQTANNETSSHQDDDEPSTSYIALVVILFILMATFTLIALYICYTKLMPGSLNSAEKEKLSKTKSDSFTVNTAAQPRSVSIGSGAYFAVKDKQDNDGNSSLRVKRIGTGEFLNIPQTPPTNIMHNDNTAF